MSEVGGAFRIGRDGMDAERWHTPTGGAHSRLVELWLEQYPQGVVFLELSTTGASWDAVDLGDVPRTFMRAGLADGFGAAELVAPHKILGTHNPAPTGDEPAVMYDEATPLYFPPDTVVPVEQVHTLMFEFARRGDWPESMPWRAHEHLLA